MPIIGLTGNYGMGKSTVAALLKEMGAIILDLDKVVDGLLNDAFVMSEIKRIFGESVFSDRGLNRSMIAEIIFKDKGKREQLEGLLHPIVIQRMREFLQKVDRKKIIVIEIPLLFEKGYEGEFDKTITVYTDSESALKRLEERGIKRNSALMRLEAQMPIEEKVKRSDFVIDNSGSLEETKRQVFFIYQKLMERD